MTNINYPTSLVHCFIIRYVCADFQRETASKSYGNGLQITFKHSNMDIMDA